MVTINSYDQQCEGFRVLMLLDDSTIRSFILFKIFSDNACQTDSGIVSRIGVLHYVILSIKNEYHLLLERPLYFTYLLKALYIID
jgi:hypothetical protein